MLVGAFQIERRGPQLIVAGLQHKAVGGARIEPHIQNIGHLFIVIGIIVRRQET